MKVNPEDNYAKIVINYSITCVIDPNPEILSQSLCKSLQLQYRYSTVCSVQLKKVFGGSLCTILIQIKVHVCDCAFRYMM